MEVYHISTREMGYPQPEENLKYMLMTYDLKNACPTCKIGKKQNNPFRFRSEPRTTQFHFFCLNWVFDEIFVSDIVKEVFEREGITGVRFSRPVIHKTGEPLKTVYQLHVDSVLSDGLISDNLITERCEYPRSEDMVKFLKAIKSNLLNGPFCGESKYNFPQRDSFVLRQDIFKDMPDFARTKEWFGSGGNANRPILISRKALDIIKREELKGAFFSPVILK